MTEQIDALKAKLKARQGKPGFGSNVKALEQRIAELEAEAANVDL